jgi:hypothetical protein
MNMKLLVASGMYALLLCSCAHQKSPREDVYVYTFVGRGPEGADETKRMIETFVGVTGDIGTLYKSDENSVYYVSKTDVSETFERDLNTGNITFNKSMKKYLGAFVPRLPSGQEAVRVAKEFLGKNALGPRDDSQLRLVHLGGLRATSVIGGNKAGPIIDEMVTVNFGRVVDGLPVFGPGSKIVVRVGDRGEIMGLIRRWRELDVAARTEIRPAETITLAEAEERAKRQIMAEYGSAASYKILSSGKAYYDNNGKILQPVYIFETTINVVDPRVKPFDYLCVIPMLKRSPEPLNLIATDPRAKRMITSPRREEKGPDEDRKRTND